ncbi:DUF1287 domain-containing protein [Solobacterium moorei]|uniref:DUF1287 domain-containing protein n=1 Tax=Solobacterium moorei TaxID=102148 RepID=A0A412PHQ9_9FIRM|nr:DUF1287 domain-containing protein [Solobacterium moorei]RGT57717.1 DUF1287 domain-containing protein [Solobacterium moorei]
MIKKSAIYVIAIVIIISVFAYRHYQNPSIKRPTGKYQVKQYHSNNDQDNDGIDDQVDILENALEYISTKPKYQSKYYSTGYSDDEYGVCTDVVAHALKNAGYDLMTLIQEDIQNHPSDYAIDQPDINIDFRRVRNLKVYFDHTAQILTTDVKDFEDWQGGDIIVFRNHIGIISDRRNERGVPYVIHHDSPWQLAYEQDILEKRNDIVGHYRISK